jgi:sRNA-binding protein
MRRYIIIAFGVVTVVGLVSFFRYEPMPPTDALWERVWDRWYGRVCLTPRPEITDIHGIACSESDVAELKSRMLAEAEARVERERPAREAQQRADSTYWAQQQAEEERTRKVRVAAQEKAEELRYTIYKYVQP